MACPVEGTLAWTSSTVPADERGEHVWTMTKGGEEAHAELRDKGMAGVELQVYSGATNSRRAAAPIARCCARGVGASPAAKRSGKDGATHEQ
jgi:hypothetical protein